MNGIDPDQQQSLQERIYARTDGNIEAHIIADMLRIESISTEIREFKQDTKERLKRIENWIIAIVGTTVTTMITVLIAVLFKAL